MSLNIITSPLLHIVLDRPCIAGNIAAIIRLSTATQCALHVCGPLVFDKQDKTKWRAGLDYFFGARVHFHRSLERCLSVLDRPIWLLEVSGKKTPWEVSFVPGDVVILGPENGSIKENVQEAYRDRIITLPHAGPVRSLNLAQCAAIVTYEAFRQSGLATATTMP